MTSRLAWLDVMKGISILWIVFFHFFGTYAEGRFPSPTGDHYFASFQQQCALTTSAEPLGCLVQAVSVAIVRVGFHAVGVFLVLSGFGLAYAMAKTGEPEDGWIGWYRRRLLRLFPMYWLAHLIYLISPFQARPEAIDYRFILSLLGDRVYPIYTIFYYVNPAWWYFGLLLQLYLVFPLLWRLLRSVGPTGFLIVCGVATLGGRYLLIEVIRAHGYYVQGAFFGARLWEFAAGMVLGLACRRDPAAFRRWLFGWPALAAGVAIYTLGLYSYARTVTYAATDACIGTGLFLILAHVARRTGTLPRFEALLMTVGTCSYGVYLVHQPYVTYFGEHMRDLDMAAFVPIAWGIIGLLTAAMVPLERSVNRLVDRLFERSKGNSRAR